LKLLTACVHRARSHGLTHGLSARKPFTQRIKNNNKITINDSNYRVSELH